MSESIWDDPRITAYVLGELSGDERTAFESACDSNPSLAAAVDEARGVTNQLQNLYAGESTPPLDAQRRDAIVGGNAGSVTLPDSESSWRVPALVLASAAVLLLLVGIAPWLRQQDTTVVMDDGESRTTTSVLESEAKTQGFSASVQAKEKSLEEVEVVTGLEVAQSSPGQGNAMPNASELADKLSSNDNLAAITQEAHPFAAADPTGEIAGRRAKKDMPSRAHSSTTRKAPAAAAPSPTPSSAPAPDGASQDLSYRSELKRRSSRQKAKNPQPMDRSEEIAEAAESLPRHYKQNAERLAQSIKEVEEQVRMQTSVREVDAEKSASAVVAEPAPLALSVAGSAPMAEDVVRRDRSIRKLVPAPGNPVPQPDGDFGAAIDEGRGPGIAGDQFTPITDNPFKRVSEEPLSTFSIDVDTASYSKTRDFLMRANQLPRPDAVRIEELINYFQYDYESPQPDAEHPFATYVEVTTCPWNSEHKIARIGLQGKTMNSDQRPACNLVFLLDTSGSMRAPNKLPLVIEGMKMLVDQLTEKDQVAITVYAGSAGLVLDSTSAEDPSQIHNALTRLSAGGSTNGGAGIALAYQTARSNFITDGVNRVILCTDGDFNVGLTGTDALVRMVEEEAKSGIFLSVLGFGMGNHNDAMLEQISGRGNGNYAFIDTPNEAHKVLVEQTNGTLVTIAKDVKLQIEFNPAHVGQYRLIGYENRILAKEDFNDDTKDAGEIGAGHSVTALYELVPAGTEADASQPKVDDLKYQRKSQPSEAADSDELMTLKLRYKQPDGDTSTLVEFPIENKSVDFDKASDDTRFAAAVAGFGMQLRRSPYAGSWTLSDVEKVAKSAKGEDDYQLRNEFVDLVRKASQLMGQQ